MRIKLNLLLGLLCVFAVTKAYCAPLSSEEARLRDHVTKRYQADLKLLQSLVNINSGTSNIAGVYRVGRVIERQLRRLGFKTSWVNEPVNMRRAGTLVAERVGTQGKKLLLIGHLDTVFPKNSPFQRAILKKNSMKGPGVLDDKGGVLVMLSALNALASIHALDHTSIIVVLTGDEEDAGKPINVSRKPLFAAAKRSDVALDFEPAITLDTISIARRGVASWSIESHGNESHSATIFIPEVGDGAIFELARILNTMRAEFKGEENLTYNPGIILGGNVLQFDKKASKGSAFGKDNIVAKVSLAHGDYRFLTTEQKKSFEARLTKIVSDHLPGTHSSVEFTDAIPPMPPTENNMKLLEQYSMVSSDLGQGIVKPFPAGKRGAGDISHIAGLVSANLVGLGPIGMGTHSVIETMELNSLPIQSQRAALLMYRLTR